MSNVTTAENIGLNNLKCSSSSKEDKLMKKHKKKSKKRKKSDPSIINISHLLSTNLSLVSPENNMIKNRLSSPTQNSSISLKNSKLLVKDKDKQENTKTRETEVEICKDSNIVDLDNELSTIDMSTKIRNITDLVLETPENNDSTKESKNAFEFMMESRNKSIGRNSPGREIEKVASPLSNETKDKLNARKLLLKKWATAKESKKRKIDEKERKIYIKHQLEKRAREMKKMLSIEVPMKKQKHKKVKKLASDSEDSQDVSLSINKNDLVINLDDEEPRDNDAKENKNDIGSYRNGLHDFLGTSADVKTNKRKHFEDDFEFDDNEGKKDNVLKIKMFSPTVFKRKRNTSKYLSANENKKEIKPEEKQKQKCNKFKRHKKKKKENDTVDEDDNEMQGKSNKVSLRQCEISKSNKKSSKDRTSKNSTHLLPSMEDEGSNDSVCLLESDTDNNTRSLRRSLRTKKPVTKYVGPIVTYLVNSDSENSSDNENNRKNSSKKEKDVKLAPIFLQSKTKQKVDPMVLEARRNFLMSGIPETLKRAMEKQQSLDNIEVNCFPEISHVQQKSTTGNGIDYWNLPKVKIHMIDLKISLPEIQPLRRGSLNKFHNESQQIPLCPPEKIKNLKSILLEIKKNNPDYPVRRSFRLLQAKANTQKMKEVAQKQNIPPKKKKNRKVQPETEEIVESENLNTFAMWTEKYKANVSKDLIGNYNSSLELKKWMRGWVDANERKSKLFERRDSSGSEFDCENDSSNSMVYPGNTVILYGPHGTGKTMTVYALCNKLRINVLELNASSKRTGKRLMQELQEATQSHQVRKNETSDLTTLLKSTNNKKGEITTKGKEPQINNSKMCLLLVEDVDVVFEHDEGFLGALMQLMSTSKRPIILVATDISSPSLQKVVSQSTVIKFSSLSSRTMSVWLQILCLLEGCFVNKDSLSELLEWNGGDVRKTLLQLQFWVQGGGGNVSPLQITTDLKANSEEHLKNDTQLSTEKIQDNEITISVHSNCISAFLDKTTIALDKFWWNLSQFSLLSPIRCDNPTANANKNRPETTKTELTILSNCFEAVSEIDKCHVKGGVIENSKLSVKNALLELKDSIELCEIYDNFSTRRDFIREWTHTLLVGHMNTCKPTKEIVLDMGLPNLEERRWQHKQSTCKTEYMEMVPASYHIDKKSFTLDYFPTLRTITRSEVARSASSNKRRNRFFSYFSSLGFSCSDSVSKTACSILDRNFIDCEKT